MSLAAKVESLTKVPFSAGSAFKSPFESSGALTDITSLTGKISSGLGEGLGSLATIQEHANTITSSLAAFQAGSLASIQSRLATLPSDLAIIKASHKVQGILGASEGKVGAGLCDLYDQALGSIKTAKKFAHDAMDEVKGHLSEVLHLVGEGINLGIEAIAAVAAAIEAAVAKVTKFLTDKLLELQAAVAKEIALIKKWAADLAANAFNAVLDQLDPCIKDGISSLMGG
jgi:hypothetical protein